MSTCIDVLLDCKHPKSCHACCSAIAGHRQHVTEVTASVWVSQPEAGMSAVECAVNGAELSLVHTFFKVELIAVLRQTLPVGSISAVDIAEWVGSYHVVAALLVHSMLDAGNLLADLFSKGPHLARSATLLQVYQQYQAEVQTALQSPLSAVSANSELLQRVAHIESMVYQQITDELWAQCNRLAQPSSVRALHQLHVDMQAQQQAWQTAGAQLLQSRFAWKEQQVLQQADEWESQWKQHQAREKASQQNHQCAVERHEGQLSAIQQKATQALEHCRTLADSQHEQAPAVVLASRIADVYEQACAKHAGLQQRPLVLPACGFEAATGCLIDMQLQCRSVVQCKLQVTGGLLVNGDEVSNSTELSSAYGLDKATCLVTQRGLFSVTATIIPAQQSLAAKAMALMQQTFASPRDDEEERHREPELPSCVFGVEEILKAHGTVRFGGIQYRPLILSCSILPSIQLCSSSSHNTGKHFCSSIWAQKPFLSCCCCHFLIHTQAVLMCHVSTVVQQHGWTP